MRIIATPETRGTETVLQRTFWMLSFAVMAENDLQSRLEMLEVRLAHQEAAIEELTRTLLNQEKQARAQALTLEALQQQLRSLAASTVAAPDDEAPPPHY